MLKLQKGHYGYIKRKKIHLIAGIIFFVIGIIGFLAIGIITTGSRRNLLTVAAVLLVLPMAKLLVVFIALLPFSGRPKEEYDRVAEIVGDGVLDVELVVTASDNKSFCMDYCVFTEKDVLVYCAQKPKEPKKAQEHLQGFLDAHELKFTVHFIPDFKPFCRRIAQEELPKRAECSEDLLKAEGVLRGLSI